MSSPARQKGSLRKGLKSGLGKVWNSLTPSRTPSPQPLTAHPSNDPQAPTPKPAALAGSSIANSLAGIAVDRQPESALAQPEPPHIVITEHLPLSATTQPTPSEGQNKDTTLTQTVQIKPTRQKSPWLVAIQATLDAVVQASDVFPPLKSTAAAIKVVIDAGDAFSGNQEEFEKLLNRVHLLTAILKSCPQDPPLEVKHRREGLERAINSLANTLKDKMSRSSLERIAFTKEDQQEVVRIVREINFAIEFAMLDVTIRNENSTLEVIKSIEWLKGQSIKEHRKLEQGITGIAKGVSELRKTEILRVLGDVKNFAYSNGTRRGECIPGSRVGLISQLLAWVEDPSSGHVFWLSGVAGTGKTAVSETLCSQLSKRGLLGASFFCSLTSQDLSDIYLVIPTLAKALAKARPAFGAALARILESDLTGDQNPLEMKLEEQYRVLILRPARETFSDHPTSIAMCVDGLDECRNKRAVKDFLDAILSNSPWPAPLKILFTSRPESSIEEHLQSPSLSDSLRQSLRLQDIERDIVRADIELYVHHQLGKIKALRDEYGENWPPPETQKIIEHSDTLFIIAATMIRHIDDESGNRIKRFRSFGSASAPKLSGIQRLYQAILEKAFESLDPEEREDVCSCLSLLVVAFRPLTVNEYAALLGRPPSTIREALRSLHSVVSVPTDKDDGQPVSIYHASFIDFLTDKPTSAPETSGTLLWTIDRTQAHSLAVERCLALMDDKERGLFFGVSGAVTSYRSNDDQPQKLCLRSDLAYACVSWGEHALCVKPLSNSFQLQLNTFLETKWLYWVEALSVEKEGRYARLLREIEKVVSLNNLKSVLIRISDFWGIFGTAVSYSAPHLYLSALPFYEAALGSSDWISLKFPSVPTVHSTGLADLARGCKVMAGPSPVNCVAISPDDNTIASGSDDGIIRLWDAWSGNLRVDIKGHTHYVKAVCFSSDGRRIASGSSDKTVMVWDVENAEAVLGPITGHTDWVTSVSFSPDGSRIVSGSGDGSVRVWDARSGAAALDPIQGHTGWVRSVCFSPDGKRIVSGSDDKTVRAWNSASGVAILDPIEGHTDFVMSVCFSPDGSRIASGSGDRSVRVWDAGSGAAASGSMAGHTNFIISTSFSPDGRTIASGSTDKTVRLWDTETGAAVSAPMMGHTGEILSVCFSSDGRRVVSGSSDKMVRVWDVGSNEAAQAEALSYEVSSICFSPDGRQIASGSNDSMVRVWNTQSGGAVLGPMKGHTELVRSICFSPDGRRIASGSDDKTVMVWDADNGRVILGPMTGHTDWLRSVCFSPDGRKLASGSDDGTVIVWDAESGAALWSAVHGHNTWVRVVCFSSDGKSIASGSDENIVMVWDAESGAAVRPVEGEAQWASSACMSPDGRKIASGTGSKVLKVWDTEARKAALDPIEAHTGFITTIRFSPSGKIIASGSHDETVRIWDAQSGEAMAVLSHSNPVFSMCFSPCGTQLATGSGDMTIRVWNIGPRKPAVLARQSFLHSYPPSTVSLDEAGWIRNASDALLLWVPPQFRGSLQLPPLELIIGGPSTTVELTNAIYHGVDWRRCIIPQSDAPQDILPWPLTSSREVKPSPL